MATSISSKVLLYCILLNTFWKWNLSSHSKSFILMSFVVYPTHRLAGYLQNRCSQLIDKMNLHKKNKTSILDSSRELDFSIFNTFMPSVAWQTDHRTKYSYNRWSLIRGIFTKKELLEKPKITPSIYFSI